MAASASQALLSAVGVPPPSAPLEEAPSRLGSRPQGSVVRDRVEGMGAVSGGLVELGVPRGLAEVIAKDDARIGMRIYLLDNSGSMNTGDGNVLHDSGGGRMMSFGGTRWDEICAFARDHARYNLKVGTPCEFMLLNSLGRSTATSLQEGVDFVCIDRSSGGEASQLERLDQLLQDNGPRGVTPLALRLEEILCRVKAEAAALAKRNQMVFLTIATDGLPTSPTSGQSTLADQRSVVEQLRRLGAALPVQLVIRLCTDDNETIDFYNGIDEELEFPLDVLDDIYGEAQEVHQKGNTWFAYSPMLHRIREAGTLCKVLDSIDERLLYPAQVRQLAELLSGSPRPLTMLSDREFINEISRLMRTAPLVYDARSRRMRPPIHVARLRAAMRVGLCGKLIANCWCFLC